MCIRDSRKAASDYLYNGGLRIYATVDTEVQTALENVWLEGKYWEPMPIENYVDPNKPDDTPPVSYTHLDVYKRQISTGTRTPICGCSAISSWSCRKNSPSCSVRKTCA